MRGYFERVWIGLLVCLAVLSIAIPQAFGQWIDELPYSARQSILWSADHEEGTLDDWGYYDFLFPGGGIFDSQNRGDVDADVSLLVAHSGVFSARTTINNAFPTDFWERSIRLMRWTDRPWDNGGFHFPGVAYYSAWIYIPENNNLQRLQPMVPEDGGWRNVFQFETHDDLGAAQSMWGLHVGFDQNTGEMEFYLSSRYNKPSTVTQIAPIQIPVGKWIHVEALYKLSAIDEGRIAIWQDGHPILDAPNVRTAMSVFDENAIWSIGVQTNRNPEGAVERSATLYFDDATVSSQRISSFLLKPERLESRPDTDLH